MSRVFSPRAVQDMQTLFSAGAVGSLADEQLVERFVNGRGHDAEIAFTALVERHGAMVEGVCRSVLGNRHDAQDAFQAAFLVLALRAGSIRRGEAVASWLFGVAQRVSTKARRSASRRISRDQAAAVSAHDFRDDPQPSDDHAILHEELQRLPEAYRAAIVLFHLEGRSYEQSAAVLGCPVGTVKSRLARGRERLKHRLIRRGFAPAVAIAIMQEVRPAAAATMRHSSEAALQAILRFAADRSIDGALSTSAVKLGCFLVRSMNMLRCVSIFGVVALGLAATGAAVYGFRPPEEPPAAPVAVTPAKPAEPKMRDYHLRVINPKGEPVPDIVIQEFEYKFEGVTARTDGDGRAKIAFDALVDLVHFRARQGDAAIAWGHYGADELGPEASADDPIVLTLFPLNQHVEGTILNTEGQPIRGVQVQVSSIYHSSNGSDGTFEPRQSTSPLGSTVTDEAGRYALVLPEESTASLSAYHPFYVGTSNGTKENGLIFEPWTLVPAGRIVGFVRNGETKAPLAHARVYAQRIDINPPILGGGTSNAETDETGRFEMGSLAAGVYNLILKTSGHDQTQTATSVEGVRVRPYEDSRADLTVITPRLLHGTAVDFNTGEPLANIPVFFYSASHPRSGGACPGTKSDEEGKFVCPVPPGETHVYIASLKYRGEGSFQTITVPADGEVPTVILKGGAAWKKPPPLPSIPRVSGLVRRSRIAETDPKETRTLQGRILDRDGLPIPGVLVHYDPPNFLKGLDKAVPVHLRLKELEPDERAARNAATDREGTFLLENLPARPVVLTLVRTDQFYVLTTIPADALEIEFTLPPEE